MNLKKCKFVEDLACHNDCAVCCLTCENGCDRRCKSSENYNKGLNLEQLLKCDGVFLAMKLAHKNKDGIYDNPSKEWDQLLDVYFFVKKLRERSKKERTYPKRRKFEQGIFWQQKIKKKAFYSGRRKISMQIIGDGSLDRCQMHQGEPLFKGTK